MNEETAVRQIRRQTAADLCSPGTIRRLKNKYGFRFSKELGQNFLTDPQVLEAMVSGSAAGKDDLVVEIGPGIGVLTAAAAQAVSRVVAIEADLRLQPILKETLAGFDNTEVVFSDVLKTDLQELIRKQRQTHGITGKTRIMGNLPYYITTPILMKLLQERLPVETITVMMQREVADRIQARPGSRTYGAISIAVQYYCQAERVMDVPRDVFLPAPKVDSAVLCLTLRDRKAAEVEDEAVFFDCVRAGFSQRRKTLINSLSGGSGWDKTLLRQVLQETGIDGGRRAETLSIQEFADIANALTYKEKPDESKEETSQDR